jgi:hypothetical protein
MDPSTAATAVGPALLCDIARAAGVSVTTVNLVSVRSLNVSSGVYTTISLDSDTFPNTITDADCAILAAGGTITAPTRRLLAGLHLSLHSRGARSLAGLPALSLTTQVVVPAASSSTATSGSGSSTTTGASGADLVATTAAVQAKIAAAMSGNAASSAGSSSSADSAVINLGPLSRLTAAWLTMQSFSVTIVGTDTATITDPQGQTVTGASAATLLSSAVQGTVAVGGNAVAQAVVEVAAASAAADAADADRRRIGAIVGGSVGGGMAFCVIVALAVWLLIVRPRQAREARELAAFSAAPADPVPEVPVAERRGSSYVVSVGDAAVAADWAGASRRGSAISSAAAAAAAWRGSVTGLSPAAVAARRSSITTAPAVVPPAASSTAADVASDAVDADSVLVAVDVAETACSAEAPHSDVPVTVVHTAPATRVAAPHASASAAAAPGHITRGETGPSKSSHRHQVPTFSIGSVDLDVGLPTPADAGSKPLPRAFIFAPKNTGAGDGLDGIVEGEEAEEAAASPAAAPGATSPDMPSPVAVDTARSGVGSPDPRDKDAPRKAILDSRTPPGHAGARPACI